LTPAERGIGRGRTAPVATVAGRPIALSRVEARLAELRRGPRGKHLPPDGGAGSVHVRRWIVQELVTEEVLACEARAAGIGDGSRATTRLVIAQLVDRVTATVTVEDAEVRAYYERNMDLYRRPEVRSVRHILVGDLDAAKGIVRRLEVGEAMEAIARAVSIDPGTRAQAGFLGDVRRGELAGALEDALFSARPGAIVGPYRTEHGWHVARVEQVIPESSAPLSEVRPSIEAELLAAARGRAFGEWLEQRRSALASIEPEFAHPADPVHGLPSHRH
jgi:hypothetical protein